MNSYLHLTTLAAMSLMATGNAIGKEYIVPKIEGPWWLIASNPRLPDGYQSDRQEPVDFAIWQAADGTWQLWSCIRHTNCGGHTRLLYGWEGKDLTDTDWTPMGVTMEANPALGEAAGGLQAPHVVRVDDGYVMAYGDWEHICFATSRDGKSFERVIQPNGRTGVFGEGPGANTRDPMLVRIDGLWHCYYTAIIHDKGYGFCRTSTDLKTWSPPFVTSYGGHIGSNPWFNECPHVVEVEPGEFVYFRNQYYGQGQTNWAYYSTNPRNFGIDNDAGIVARLSIAAPEVIFHEGGYYLASLKPTLDGIQMSRLAFYRGGAPDRPVFDFTDGAARAEWKVVEGTFPVVFTDSPHAEMRGPDRFVISTAELGEGKHDDGLTGVIESPSFALTEDRYYVFVGGGGNREEVYVAIIEEESRRELARFTGSHSNLFQRWSFETGDAKHKTVRIRVVDHATGGWGHINFGGIYTEGARTRIR